MNNKSIIEKSSKAALPYQSLYGKGQFKGVTVCSGKGLNLPNKTHRGSIDIQNLIKSDAIVFVLRISMQSRDWHT